LPTWARVGIGIAVEIVFVGFILLRGPRAVAQQAVATTAAGQAAAT
jgi:hypothetical protein